MITLLWKRAALSECFTFNWKNGNLYMHETGKISPAGLALVL